MERRTGFIAHINVSGGFGFIRTGAEPDHFFKFQNVTAPRPLEVQDKVNFASRPATNGKKPVAVDVKLIEELPEAA